MMTIGDGTDAAAAGMDVPDGTEAANLIAAMMVLTRDYVANGPAYWKPATVVAIAEGGTGATSAAGARSALGVADAGNLTTGTLDAARLPSHQHSISGTNGVTGLQSALDGKADDSYVKNRVGASPASQQPLYNPYGRANAVATSWVAAALDGTGRLGIQPSSIRFKTVHGEFDGSVLGLQPVLYVLNADENDEVRVGLVAEEVAETFPQGVVRDAQGEPLALQLDAIVAALIGDVKRLAAEVETLKAGA